MEDGPSPAFVSTAGHAGLAGKVKGSSRKDWDTRKFTGPWVELLCPAQQVRATSSKWEWFFLPPENSSHVDTEPQYPCRGTPGHLRQHRLNRERPGLNSKGQGASAGHLVHSSFLGPHILLYLGPRSPSGRPQSSMGHVPSGRGRALGQADTGFLARATV